VKPDDLFDIRAPCRTTHFTCATQRRYQWWESIVNGSVRIGANLEQCADEYERAMVDGIDETRTNRQRHLAVRHERRVADCRAQRLEVATSECLG
jgi:hypothetical protein